MPKPLNLFQRNHLDSGTPAPGKEVSRSRTRLGTVATPGGYELESPP